MKIAKVLMVVLAVSLCCATANAQDECSTAVAASCGGSVTLDPFADTVSGTAFAHSCSAGVCSGFTAACFTDANCPAGETCSWTDPGVNDVFATFVATDTTARLRTDAGGSIGTDSEYVVYSVDQTAICDDTSWVELGCSADDAPGTFLGDISIGGLTVGDTYLVQFGHWADAYSGSYELTIECPTAGATCGDGVISLVPGAEQCDGAATGDCLLTCEADCTCTPVPTPMLPKWGLIGLAAMLVLGGAAVFGRGRLGFEQA